jgi:3'-phosphoadenosine 5'-phosphosulfate sulfotransferase (PAPS reductase)/FAD synthetase
LKLEQLEKIINKHDLAVIACSFGRDSMVVLDMVSKVCRKINKPFKIIWNDTGVEYPEQYKFNKKVIEQYKLEKNLIIAKSQEWTFWKIKDTYGMPIAPRDSRNREMQQATQSCCNYLKKKPTKEVLKEFKDINYVYLTGLTANESMNRRASAKRYGDYFYSKSWKHYKCHPILWWSDEEIDNYITENKVPLCEIYKWNEIEGYKIRNGCWCCPQAWKFGKGKWIKRYYPELYKFLITKTELGEYILTEKLGIDKDVYQLSLLDDNLKEKVIHTFELRPCFFEDFK